MIKKFISGLALLVLVALLLEIFPQASQAQQDGSGNFVFVNYVGQDLVLDLDDVTYTVPGTARAPEGGRLSLTLAPGEHKYAANVPGVPTGSAGTFVIASGVVAKAARLDQTPATLDRQGNVIAKPEDYVHVFDVDLNAPAAAPAPAVDTWQPAAASPGMGSLAWTNYTGDELTVDLAGKIYKVPPQANSIPGRLQIDVTPGLYKYTASIPYGSVNGEVNLAPGQVVGLNVSAEVQPKPEYDLGEPSPLPLPVTLRLFQEDLTARAGGSSQASQAVPAAPTATAVPASANAPARPEGLLIKNFIGETVIFTINGQAYSVPANAEQTLQLPPGEYNFTASLPYVARTGTIVLKAGQGVELSLATTINHDVLNVYQN